LIRVGRLSYENFDEFLNDKGFNVIILNAIDSCFNPESDSQKE